MSQHAYMPMFANPQLMLWYGISGTDRGSKAARLTVSGMGLKCPFSVACLAVLINHPYTTLYLAHLQLLSATYSLLSWKAQGSLLKPQVGGTKKSQLVLTDHGS